MKSRLFWSVWSSILVPSYPSPLQLSALLSPLRAVPSGKHQPEQHHVLYTHFTHLSSPEHDWHFSTINWNPRRQSVAKLENCEHRKLSWQFRWSRLSADLQYKIEPYKYQHLNDFKAFVTMGKLGPSPEPGSVLWSMCWNHKYSHSLHPQAAAPPGAHRTHQGRPRVSKQEMTLLFSRFLLQCTMDGAPVISTGKRSLFSTIYPSSPNTTVFI